MHNYDFNALNDKEFEALANDLLSKRDGVQIDRFKAGKDGGIDGRYFSPDGGSIIIQSKHWLKSGVKALLKHLQKTEYTKIKKLNPKRYILVTSLELSPKNKKDIHSALKPYILSEDDIVGRENLNALLANYPEVEKNHYKLWLSSSAVLDLMLNFPLEGRSQEKKEQIAEQVEKYVITHNHNLALEKLNETHAVIITGEAGIGKTTLADQLTYYHMAHGYELCVIEDDISEAEAVFTKGQKKLFYYDDFLGRNYLVAIEGKKDSRIIDFIERVRKDKTKRFILTSRSTVLKQGKTISDLLEIKRLEDKEYELTIQSLSTFDKAQILYNHIWHSGLSEDYIDSLYVDRRYLKIVKHRNYNPRLISFITDPIRLSDIPSEQYWGYIETTLENPKDIWAHVFDKQLDDLMRIAVCLVVFNGGSIEEAMLEEAFRVRAIEDGLMTKANANNRYALMIKAIVGSMLNRIISANSNKTIISLFNPSVTDFVLGRLTNDHNALIDYYLCLDTVESLHHLESLHSNNKLDSSRYYAILESLAREKLSSQILLQKATYFIRLSKLVIKNEDSLPPNIVKLVSSSLEGAGHMPIKTGHIYDATFVLDMLLLSQNISQRLHDIVVSFIRDASKEADEHDDYTALNGLAKNLGDSEFCDDAIQEEVERTIKECFFDYWSDAISDNVSEAGILDNFMNPEEAHHAYDALYEYLRDHLKEFEFAPAELRHMVEFYDIDEKIIANIESAMYDDDYLGSVSEGLGSTSDVDEDSMVDELFYRDR